MRRSGSELTCDERYEAAEYDGVDVDVVVLHIISRRWLGSCAPLTTHNFKPKPEGLQQKQSLEKVRVKITVVKIARRAEKELLGYARLGRCVRGRVRRLFSGARKTSDSPFLLFFTMFFYLFFNVSSFSRAGKQTEQHPVPETQNKKL